MAGISSGLEGINWEPTGIPVADFPQEVREKFTIWRPYDDGYTTESEGRSAMIGIPRRVDFAGFPAPVEQSAAISEMCNERGLDKTELLWDISVFGFANCVELDAFCSRFQQSLSKRRGVGISVIFIHPDSFGLTGKAYMRATNYVDSTFKTIRDNFVEPRLILDCKHGQPFPKLDALRRLSVAHSIHTLRPMVNFFMATVLYLDKPIGHTDWWDKEKWDKMAIRAAVNNRDPPPFIMHSGAAHSEPARLRRWLITRKKYTGLVSA